MKTCTHNGCNNPVFSKGICKYHYRYTPKEKVKKVLSSICSGQMDLFNKIWGSRPHKSELSRQPLDQFKNTQYFVWLFAHILPKGQFPMFKLEEENILLISPEEHRLIDFGTCDERMEYNEVANYKCNWDVFYQRKEYLKVKYNERLKQIL
jgi:hypothetical protein